MTLAAASDAPLLPPSRRRPPVAAWGWGGLLAVVLATSLGAGVVAPFDPLLQLPDGVTGLGAPLAPSTAHWLGTDELGRDVFSRLLHGGRVSLLVAGTATSLAGLIGISLGLLAGYAGGLVDQLVMRLTEVVMAFPALLLAIALAAVLPPGAGSAILTLGLVGWPSLARMVRGSVLSLREQEFVEAGRALGAGHRWLLWRHIWPNVQSLALTLLALKFADMLLMEAALGFLGLGVPPPTPSWGAMIGDARGYFYHAPWLGLPAGVAIFGVVLAVNQLADRSARLRR
ncbi:MAG: ABC transporter permease [Candidatus Sericytochromatia bacterium]|nr:ABC transporter permease [Candidatus Sericytochromatia bacterium]